jgi:hypothetical protein
MNIAFRPGSQVLGMDNTCACGGVHCTPYIVHQPNGTAQLTSFCYKCGKTIIHNEWKETNHEKRTTKRHA